MKPSWSGVEERPHHRRVRQISSGPRSSRRSWLVVLGVGMGILASVTALTVGSFVLQSFSTSHQISAYGLPTPPAGVSFVTAQAEIVSATTSPSTGGCAAANNGTYHNATPLVNNASVGVCIVPEAGGFSSGDTMYVIVILWSTGALNSTKFEVQVAIYGTSILDSNLNSSVKSFVSTPAGSVLNEQAVYALDLTREGYGTVTSFNAIVTQLS